MLSCPICRQQPPHHKMDCENAAYVQELTELYEAAINKIEAYWADPTENDAGAVLSEIYKMLKAEEDKLWEEN